MTNPSLEPEEYDARRSLGFGTQNARVGADTLTFRLTQGLAGLRAIEPEWTRVTRGLSSGRRHFHLYPWFECYLSTIDPDPEAVRFVVAYRRDEPVAILPLRPALRRVQGMTLRVLEVPWCPPLSYSDLIVNPALAGRDVFPAFRAFLSRRGVRWDALLMSAVLRDAFAWSFLDAPLPRVLRLSANSCDYFSRDTRYAEVSARLSRKFRENLRRARRRLSEVGTVALETVREPGALPAAFGMFLDIEASGWKGKCGTALSYNGVLTEFHRRLLDVFGAAGACEINLLRVDDRVVAAQICLVVDGIAYALKIAYDHAYRRCTPGRLLLDGVLQRSLEQGRDLNLLSDASWQWDWQPQRLEAFDIYYFNTTPRAAAAWSAMVARRGLPYLLRRVRARRRRSAS